MILLADGGASKISWALLKENQVYKQFYTKGLNPISMSECDLDMELSQVVHSHFTLQELSLIKDIYYYGAGCGLEKNGIKFRNILNKFFKNANINVDTDIKEAAYSLCGHCSGIVCILGTGSNSCYYDGYKILKQFPSTGYLLGDEGSGYAIGRKLLKYYMEDRLSTSVKSQFENTYHLSYSEIITQIYTLKNPKSYIASFANFVSEHKTEIELKSIYESEFLDFFTNILFYYNNTKNDLYLTGSIANAFKTELQKIGKHLNLQIKKIEKEPMKGLIEYHINYH